ncbi:ribonuclease D [Vibrio methylphosphonaticus]|uniref:ribonuclease D n=1 Tax=Vibrio methylphosphonaticus TaxID=2946866 RepID=UPI00202A5747|nr:ribonuclease D [Vibrio methylphosphonaticus]MCL9773193.1 ribonuclease D [Vibrio methylphosphonaticus]
MEYQIITEFAELESVCTKARESDVVMLDTEFVRIRTYYPKLGLIQLYDGHQLSLIDPLTISDFSPFIALLQDASVLKVLHACGEDLEVFANSFGCMPFPMVDTQIMAAFLGYGLSTGFAALVDEYIDVQLDKSESRADWVARPLTQKQLDYAAADVFYLWPLYQQLSEKIEEKGWWDAALQESELMTQKRGKTPNAERAYLDIKGAWQLSPKQLAALKPLATWRLKEAIRRDLALNFVVKEQDLWTIARFGLTQPKAMEEEGLDPRSIRRHADKIASIVKSAKQLSADEYPDKIERLMDYPGYKQIFKLLKDEVKVASQQTGLATEFLASKKQLNQFLSWIWKKDRDPAQLPDVMQGWRMDVLGRHLEKRMS